MPGYIFNDGRHGSPDEWVFSLSLLGQSRTQSVDGLTTLQHLLRSIGTTTLQACSNLDGWSIDLRTGHLAHPSGLYAYLDPSITTSGALKCVGPFSSPHTDIAPSSMLQYVACATQDVERMFSANDRYCIWGSYARSIETTHTKVSILGDEYAFIANPALRSAAAFEMLGPMRTELLCREWYVRPGSANAVHRMGLEFRFESLQPHRKALHCKVSAVPTVDLSIVPIPILRPIMCALSGIAFRVIHDVNRLGSGFRVKCNIGIELDETLERLSTSLN